MNNTSLLIVVIGLVIAAALYLFKDKLGAVSAMVPEEPKTPDDNLNPDDKAKRVRASVKPKTRIIRDVIARGPTVTTVPSGPSLRGPSPVYKPSLKPVAV